MKDETENLSDVIAWADAFIEKHRDEFERMHGYTSEMERHDKLADDIRKRRDTEKRALNKR